MKNILTLSKIWLSLAICLFFLIVSFNNIVDYDTNFMFVEHVMKMDTIFSKDVRAQRAILSPVAHHMVYGLIILVEVVTSVILFLGILQAWFARNNAQAFINAKRNIILGLLLGSLLYGIGFMVIGNEWFMSWQSETWNSKSACGTILDYIILVLIFIALPDDKMDSR